MSSRAVDIFELADGFADCAEMCEIERDGCVRLNSKSRFVAGVTNSALACELYLKALLASLGHDEVFKGKEGHELDRLFERLRSMNDGLVQEIEDKVMRSMELGGLTFMEALESSNKVFVCWRYAYEHWPPKGFPQYLRILRLVLRSVGRRIVFADSAVAVEPDTMR